MSHDELKEQGNECIKQKRYEDAVTLYTAALKHNPSSHTVYSNRSLAYSKLGKFDSALKDATKCIEISPTFARAYLRKCVALNGLREHEGAMTAAEEGYKLRGSSAICRDCVSQWMEANQAHHKDMVEGCARDIGVDVPDLLPKGCIVISSDYLTLFLNVFLCRLEYTTTGVEVGFMRGCILGVLQEFDRVLRLFGHTPSPCEQEWLDNLCLTSKIDPSSSRIPQSVVATLIAKSDEFVAWLDSAVDHTLYPILRPVMSLAMMTVGARCISLNVINTEQHTVQVSCRACLPFFEKSLLSSTEYFEQHIGMYKELLESFATCNFRLTSEENLLIEQSIAKLEALLKKFDPTKHYKEIYDKAMVSVGLAQIRLKQNPCFHPASYAPECGQIISSLAEKHPEEVKAYVKEKQLMIQSVVDAQAAVPEVTAIDIQDLLWCIGALLECGEKKMALESLSLAELAYMKIFRQQIDGTAFTLDEGVMSFHIPQIRVLQNVGPFLGVENQVVADVVIRWKCIYSEFYAILIRLGAGKGYRKTFQALQQMKMEGNKPGENPLIALSEEHQHEANKMMKEKGKPVLSCLLRQSYEQVQKVLKPDQLVLEYCHQDKDVPQSGKVDFHLSGFLVVIRPEGAAVVKQIDFTKLFHLAEKWSELLAMIAAQETRTNTPQREESTAVAHDLCKLLLPDDVPSLLNKPEVRRVFICPEAFLAVLPLELLPFEDGQLLMEKCSVVYLSSARELLRGLVITATVLIEALLADLEPATQERTSSKPTEDTQEGTSSEAIEGTQEGTSSEAIEGTQERTSSEAIEGTQERTSSEATEGTQERTSSEAIEDTQEGTSYKAIEGTQEGTSFKAIEGTQETRETEEESRAKKCIIFADPNYDLEASTPESETDLWESLISPFASLFTQQPPTEGKLPPVPRLGESKQEASDICQVLTRAGKHLQVQCKMGDDATLISALEVDSPFILHFSTHGFSHPESRLFRSTFWDDTKSGLLLAGANTFRAGKFKKMTKEAGTGELTALAACGMNLQETYLVYLSGCVTSYGLYSYGESINSLAQAFRSAGAHTVIATLWEVEDESARNFATYFYQAVCKCGVPPSQALAHAKKKLKEETSFDNWAFWSSFVCIGEDVPLFPGSTDH